MSPYAYSHLRSPPKSKSPFYAASNHWRDTTPIPLLEADPSKPDPGPALATIAYSDRYLEAMSYLRAVMAKNEASERVLALTEDIVGMNPAHYTVWGFRTRSLRGLWGVGEYEGKENVVNEDIDHEERERRVREGVEMELDWLEGVSERNLKNYQIWYASLMIFLAPCASLSTKGRLSIADRRPHNSSSSNVSQASPTIPPLPPPTAHQLIPDHSNNHLPPRHRNPLSNTHPLLRRQKLPRLDIPPMALSPLLEYTPHSTPNLRRPPTTKQRSCRNRKTH